MKFGMVGWNFENDVRWFLCQKMALQATASFTNIVTPKVYSHKSLLFFHAKWIELILLKLDNNVVNTAEWHSVWIIKILF